MVVRLAGPAESLCLSLVFFFRGGFFSTFFLLKLSERRVCMLASSRGLSAAERMFDVCPGNALH